MKANQPLLKVHVGLIAIITVKYSTVHSICQLRVSTAGKWKDYPIAVTAYGYLFGSLFMGSFTLYYIWSGQPEQFLIPQHVSKHKRRYRGFQIV